MDLVNTVVCRSDPARRADRFAVPANLANLAEFAAAAAFYRREELGSNAVCAPEHEDLPKIVVLREAIDGWLRPQAEGRRESGEALRRLFAAAADCVDADDGDPCSVNFGRAAAVSSMKLLDETLRLRIKICPGCDWLFVDRSKNRSRIWCDMAVCGNRAKASSHYFRRKLSSFGEGAKQ